MAQSEYEKYCTLIIQRSHLHYVQPSAVSVAASFVAAAAGAKSQNVQDPVNFPQQPVLTDLQKRLEDTRDSVKLQALKEVILWVLQPGVQDNSGIPGGNVASKLLITVIRFVLPSTNNKIRKMLQIYWEIVDKTKADGSLKDEMILVCNKLREDLLSANEYIRGSTLRLLCKIKYIKILQPLLDSIVQNLHNPHAYVRRNAVVCIFAIMKSHGVEILSHVFDEIENLLAIETDLNTKRNAILLLTQFSIDRALKYAISIQDQFSSLGDMSQLSLLQLLRKVSQHRTNNASDLLSFIISLMESCSPAVAYEGASCLLQLSSSPMALKAASRALISLLTGQSDNNVKLIVLDRLNYISIQHQEVLEEHLMDFLRVLKTPSADIKSKSLHTAFKLVNRTNLAHAVPELTGYILAEKSRDSEASSTDLLLYTKAIRRATLKYPDVDSKASNLLSNLRSWKDAEVCFEASSFFTDLAICVPREREINCVAWLAHLHQIKHGKSARMACWVLGEYAANYNLREKSVDEIFAALSPLPLIQDQQHSAPLDMTLEDAKIVTKTIVLPDGTYSVEEVYETPRHSNENSPTLRSNFRALVVDGDFHLCAIIARALIKLCYQVEAIRPAVAAVVDDVHKAKAVMVVASLYKLVTENVNGGFGCDSAIAIKACLKVLTEHSFTLPFMRASAEDAVKASEIGRRNVEIEEGMKDKLFSESLNIETRNDAEVCYPESPILFRPMGAFERDRTMDVAMVDPEAQLAIALGTCSLKEDLVIFQKRLDKVQQLSGLSDPIYVEAFLQANQFTLSVEYLVINRLSETLQNITLELSTHGDLKIVDRPLSVTLSGGESTILRSSVKVQSTEAGIIFSHTTFERCSSVEREYLVLHELHLDTLEFVKPSWIGEQSFRKLWSESEWENKVNICTTISDVETFIRHIMKHTNMTIVGCPLKTKTNNPNFCNWSVYDTASNASELDEIFAVAHSNSSFFATNLYSRSAFGEHALANISIEKQRDGNLAGSVRIRSRTQGIALSLGDRLSVLQRVPVLP